MGKILAVIMVFSFGLQAQAFIIEPYVGIESGSDANSKTTSGTSFGLRAGMTTLGFMYGLEYQTASLTVKATTDLSVTATDLGFFFGYEAPILVRGYLTIGFASGLDAGAIVYEGKQTKIGFGYTGLPFVAINVESITRKYTKYKTGGLEGTSSYKIQTTMISLSLQLP